MRSINKKIPVALMTLGMLLGSIPHAAYSGSPVAAENPALPSGSPVAAENPAAPSGSPVVAENPAAPSGSPVVAENPAAPLGSPVAAENPAAPSGSPVAAENPAAPLGSPVAAENPAAPLGSPVAAENPASSPPFATVGGEVIEGNVYIQTMREAVRQKFYHGNVPQNEMAKFQRKVGDQLVDRILLLKEAKKRDIRPNADEITKTIEEYDKRYQNSEKWKANRDKMLQPLIKELEARSVLGQLEAQVRAVKPPSDKELTDFYNNNPSKFTEPMDQKVSLILLKVDPSAGGEAWEKAKTEAASLVEKLRAGADFAEMARIHSGDPSAENGGRMKYVHKGSLAEDVEKALEPLKIGDVTEPVVVLEGVAIFRLDDRTPPDLISFKEARQRAEKLLVGKLGDTAWQSLKERLRKEDPPSINEDYYLPMPKEGDTSGGHPQTSHGGGTK